MKLRYGEGSYLEVDDDKEYYHRCQQARYIRSVFSVEGMLQRNNFVRFGQQRVEESDNGTLEFCVLLGFDGDGWETFPEDDLTNIGSNEQTDTVSKTVALL